MGGHQNYYSDQFVMYINVESLFSIPETDIICQLYFN